MVQAVRENARVDDSEECAREAIHVPGSIQPHGFLLVLHEPDLRVVQASANVEDFLGLPAGDLLGRPLGESVPDLPAALQAASGLDEEDANPLHLGDLPVRRRGQTPAVFSVLAHRTAGLLIAEFEPATSVAGAFHTIYPLVRTFLARLQSASSIEEICRLTVAEVKRITGFGRVLAYRFQADGHGHVLAEDAAEGYDRYEGLYFPASDIPPQARELYRRNRVRVIQDARYRPVPLVPQLNPVTGEALDMSHAGLRSVSPVHLQYMHNMGTMASMSISILVDGKLWGLVSCHNAEARAVSLQTRTACELIGRIISLQIEAHERHAQVAARLAMRRGVVDMLAAMADRDSITEGLAAVSDAFLAFARAQGGAVIAGERCELFGRTPPREVVQALSQWLANRHAQADVYCSSNLAADVPELPALAEHAAGLLAVPISELHSHYLLWFRPEIVRTVSWAGPPGKLERDDAGRLSPRRSFAMWQETVRGTSEPWHAAEIEGARELRSAVLGIVLRQAEEMAELAATLRETNRELEAFSYSVSHDLRAPLRHIVGYAELLNDFEGDKLSERGLRFLGNIGDSARFAGTLVDNLLSFSQMGRAALRHSDVNLEALVESIRREMAPDLEGRRIDWRVGQLPVVVADPAFIHLALRNLLGNAAKYTRGRDPAVIEVGAERREGEIVVHVRDNGVGFNMQYVNKLFGVFQRLHRMEDFEGTGIGLASVRRIIERHDGRVWAEGEPGRGATFYFSLPDRGYSH